MVLSLSIGASGAAIDIKEAKSQNSTLFFIRAEKRHLLISSYYCTRKSTIDILCEPFLRDRLYYSIVLVLARGINHESPEQIRKNNSAFQFCLVGVVNLHGVCCVLDLNKVRVME